MGHSRQKTFSKRERAFIMARRDLLDHPVCDDSCEDERGFCMIRREYEWAFLALSPQERRRLFGQKLLKNMDSMDFG